MQGGGAGRSIYRYARAPGCAAACGGGGGGVTRSMELLAAPVFPPQRAPPAPIQLRPLGRGWLRAAAHPHIQRQSLAEAGRRRTAAALVALRGILFHSKRSRGSWAIGA